MKSKCFECGTYANTHKHHVLPKSKGGKSTVNLCESCHSKVHKKDLNITYLTRLSLFKKNKDLMCRIFFNITVHHMPVSAIALDISQILDLKFSVQQVRQRINRMKKIHTVDIIDTFSDILEINKCSFLDIDYYSNEWNKYKNQ